MNTMYASGVIQNTCDCVAYNEEEGDWQPSGDCFGCWDEYTENWEFGVKELFDSPNYTGWWKIEGFPVWNGTITGLFQADTAEKLLDSITPDRTEWILRYEITSDRITGTLSHHDAPTGGQITVTMITDPDEGVS